MKRFALLTFCVAVTACTWSHPYKGESEFNQDRYDCQMAVNQSVPQPRQISPQDYAAMSPAQRGAAGSYQGGQQMGTGINQMMMFNSCMKSRGWQ
jgi:hypothetical protein